METMQKTIHIFVNKTKIEFEVNHVTGKQIKEKAGVVPDSLLYRKLHDQLELIKDDQTIEIKEGEHFIDLPGGTVS